MSTTLRPAIGLLFALACVQACSIRHAAGRRLITLASSRDTRRGFFESSVTAATVAALGAIPAVSLAAETPRSVRATAYRVERTNPPGMQPFNPGSERRAIEALGRRPALILGGHGNPLDAALAGKLVQQLSVASAARGVVVALAGAIMAGGTQRALDDFVARVDSDDTRAEEAVALATEWAAGESAAGTMPLLRAARKSGGISLVAVGLEHQLLAAVEARGLEILGAQSQKLVQDPKSFMEVNP